MYLYKRIVRGKLFWCPLKVYNEPPYVWDTSLNCCNNFKIYMNGNWGF